MRTTKYKIVFAQYFEVEINALSEEDAIDDARQIYELDNDWLMEEIEEMDE